MQKAIEMLNEVKESIINAYEIKSGISRNKIARMMEEETWMDARKAVELGFADGILERQQDVVPTTENSLFFSQRAVSNALMNKLINIQESAPIKDQQVDRLACDLYSRLDLLKKNMYNCSAARPKIESKTTEEEKEEQTETLSLKIRPLQSGYVKAKTGDKTAETTYTDWYKTVYLPTMTAPTAATVTK